MNVRRKIFYDAVICTMKYFTKEWFMLMQRCDYTICNKPIADKEYTDEEIAALYDKKLKAEIARDRREYNTPPQMIEFDFEHAELDDFAFYDEETGTMKHPKSMEEVKRGYEEEQARAAEEFASRPPFDPKETIEGFEEAYQGGLKYGYTRFPDWVQDEVDIRLIALGYLPQSVYDRLKTEQKQNKAAFDKINREAGKALKKESQKIPERISSDFDFHDGVVLSLEQDGEDLVMTVDQYGVPFEGETPYARVTFTNAKILERDEGLTFGGDNECIWLYEELYKTQSGYEAHMMLSVEELCYLTVDCDDIVIEKNIEIEN